MGIKEEPMYKKEKEEGKFRAPFPKTSVPFSSAQGKVLFRDSLSKGYANNYFILAEQYQRQLEPTFCGVSTLTMVLNALSVRFY